LKNEQGQHLEVVYATVPVPSPVEADVVPDRHSQASPAGLAAVQKSVLKLTGKDDKTNYLNTILIVLSLGLAWFVPFQLFVFSYAVLGPLHYLTEISWLHDRNYFTNGKKFNNALWLLAIVPAILMMGLGQDEKTTILLFSQFVFGALATAIFACTMEK